MGHGCLEELCDSFALASLHVGATCGALAGEAGRDGLSRHCFFVQHLAD